MKNAEIVLRPGTLPRDIVGLSSETRVAPQLYSTGTSTTPCTGTGIVQSMSCDGSRTGVPILDFFTTVCMDTTVCMTYGVPIWMTSVIFEVFTWSFYGTRTYGTLSTDTTPSRCRHSTRTRTKQDPNSQRLRSTLSNSIGTQ
jgi:hypothetical protein